ncbi:hypothetical protein CYMTET_16584 [Cymbomonas tetramitiformis]|uniref:Uncharacterized protein n=1 Tax=Cymbomonas tetramitiformis TaxID=36881 RepID=A0AAE0FIL0_9CHLO|nr:hypothetical protein CYMTET_30726 [Cymbomonas tetramitiformis]KAK3275275.1 hypothetical protein CYMTET_16584 [Cymbomonas tetramitiformis]
MRPAFSDENSSACSLLSAENHTPESSEPFEEPEVDNLQNNETSNSNLQNNETSNSDNVWSNWSEGYDSPAEEEPEVDGQPDEPEAPDERTWKYKSQSLPSTLAFDAEKFTNETLRAAALSPDEDSHVKGLSLLFEAAPWFDIVNGINYPTAHLLNHGIADKFLKLGNSVYIYPLLVYTMLFHSLFWRTPCSFCTWLCYTYGLGVIPD